MPVHVKVTSGTTVTHTTTVPDDGLGPVTIWWSCVPFPKCGADAGGSKKVFVATGKMVLVTVTVVHSSVVEVLVIDTFGRTLTVVVVVRVPVAHVDGSGVDIIVVLYGLRSQTRRGTTGFRSTAYHVNIRNQLPWKQAFERSFWNCTHHFCTED
jgi:hypothetical protein